MSLYRLKIATVHDMVVRLLKLTSALKPSPIPFGVGEGFFAFYCAIVEMPAQNNAPINNEPINNEPSPYLELQSLLNEFLPQLYENREKVILQNGHNDISHMTHFVIQNAEGLLNALVHPVNNQNQNMGVGGKRRKNKKTRKQRK